MDELISCSGFEEERLISILSGEVLPDLEELYVLSRITDVSMDSLVGTLGNRGKVAYMREKMNSDLQYKAYVENIFRDYDIHGENSQYHAAVLLFHQLVEENKERGKMIEMVHNWSCGNRNVVNNIGRLRIKRYLAIMANNELRKKHFHF